MEDREKVRKEALKFLRDELNTLQDRRNWEEVRWQEAAARLRNLSANVKFWRFWWFIQKWVATREMHSADAKLRNIRKRDDATRRAAVSLRAGFSPDGSILDLFQQIANEALMAQVRLATVGMEVGVGAESNPVNTRSETAHQLVEALRKEYRSVYGRVA